MGVIRGGDDDAIQVCFLFEHLPVVDIELRVRISAAHSGRIPFVDITEDGDVFTRALLEVGFAHASDPDSGEPQLVAGGVFAKDGKIQELHTTESEGTAGEGGPAGERRGGRFSFHDGREGECGSS